MAKGDLDLGKLAERRRRKRSRRSPSEFKELVEQVKAALGEKVKDVRVTLRLTDSPACLVVDERAMSGHLERLLKQRARKRRHEARSSKSIRITRWCSG